MAGATIANAYVQILPSMEGVKGNLEKEFGIEGDRAGSGFGQRLMKAAKKFIAAGAIGKLIKDSISAGGELEQSIGGIETLFGAGGRSLEEYAAKVGKSTDEVRGEYAELMQAQTEVMNNASQAYKTVGMSSNDYMQNVTSFAASLKQSLGGDTVAAAKVADMAMRDMSDNANKMGTDMESITNAYQGFAKQNYTMLDNLKLGYGGTKEEMERLLRDAEKIHEETTGEVTHYDINNLADVYNAIHDIQDNLDITGTTAREAANTMQGSLNMLKASWQDLLGNVALGNDITPNVEALFESAITVAKNFIPALWNIIKGIPTGIINALNTEAPKLWTWVSENIDTIMARVKEQVPVFLAGLGDFLADLAIFIVQSAPQIIGAVLALIGAVATGIQDALAGMIQPFVDSVKLQLHAGWDQMKVDALAKWGELKASAAAVWESIKTSITTKAQNTVTAVADKFAAVKSAIIKPFELARDKIRGIIDAIKGFFKFSVSTPHIPVPHFSISPSGWKVGDLLKGKIPKLSVKWMAQGGILDAPTLIGAGEAGPEAVLPLDRLWTELDRRYNQGGLSQEQAGVLLRILDRIVLLLEEGKTISLNRREFARLVSEVQ